MILLDGKKNKKNKLNMKEVFQSVLLNRQDKFYHDCQMGKYEIPSEGKGKQTIIFKKNQTVKSTGKGGVKAGLLGTVKETYKQNGYWYHVVSWDHGSESVERQKDICFAR